MGHAHVCINFSMMYVFYRHFTAVLLLFLSYLVFYILSNFYYVTFCVLAFFAYVYFRFGIILNYMQSRNLKKNTTFFYLYYLITGSVIRKKIFKQLNIVQIHFRSSKNPWKKKEKKPYLSSLLLRPWVKFLSNIILFLAALAHMMYLFLSKPEAN